MAAPVIYRHSDPSAPTLTGAVGSLNAVLDACLVNGYGSKSAAGWTKPYTGTNIAVFRQGAGNQFYCRVEDAASGAGVAKEAFARGYEVKANALDAVDGTNTGSFPTAAQVTTGDVIRKSVSADTVPRGWLVVADDRTVYLFIYSGDTAGTYMAFMFGDIYSFTTSDAYRTMIIGGATPNSTSTNRNLETGSQSLGSGVTGNYLARVAAGTGTSAPCGKTSVLGSAPTGTAGNALPTPDGNVYLGRYLVGDFSVGGMPRGYLRGLWNIALTGATVQDGDTFSGSGTLAGRTFMVVKAVGTNVLPMLLETTAWDTSS